MFATTHTHTNSGRIMFYAAERDTEYFELTDVKRAPDSICCYNSVQDSFCNGLELHDSFIMLAGGEEDGAEYACADTRR
jgi:hypothetical protein